MVLKAPDIRKQRTVRSMRQETTEFSPTVGFPSYSTGKGTSWTPKDSLSREDGVESLGGLQNRSSEKREHHRGL